MALVWACLLTWGGCSRKEGAVVVVYTAQDQVYAEPIFREFTRQSGIRVRAVFDSEAVKTVALANRLLAERSHPQCDVFWGNEEFRARQLLAQGVFRETNALAVFGFRTRRIVLNTNKLDVSLAPHSLLELTNSAWRGKLALAYPLFGTTATHFMALRQAWGEDVWVSWCRGLQSNQPLLVDGNSAVVKLVGQGEAVIGLTDSDDVAAGQREGLPITCVPVNGDTLYIPNAVGITRNAPHAREADELAAYLQQPRVLETLVQANALEGTNSAVPHGLRPDWEGMLRDLDATTAVLKTIFLRR